MGSCMAAPTHHTSKNAYMTSSPHGGASSVTWCPSSVSRDAASSIAFRFPAATSIWIGVAVVQAIRRRPGARPASSTNGRSGGGAQYVSPRTCPEMMSRKAAASFTVRAMGPLWDRRFVGRLHAETRPRVGLIPNRPQHDDGIRIEPPPSLPCEIGQRPEARAAAAPPEDPPGVRSGSHGLRVGPNTSGSVNGTEPNSGRVVQVLDRDRHAVEWRETFSPDNRFGLTGFIQRAVEAGGDVCVEPGVDLLDPTGVELDELDRRDLLLPHH